MENAGKGGGGIKEEEKSSTLARKPLDSKKRPLNFTVEFIY